MSTLREELNTIYQAHRELTPQLVVEVARDPANPLHDRFEWDDSVAGEKYRLSQARQLIRSVRVTEVVEDGIERVRAFHSVTRADRTTYVPIEELQQDDFAARLLLRQAEFDWRNLLRRYQHLEAFLDMVREDVAS